MSSPAVVEHVVQSKLHVWAQARGLDKYQIELLEMLLGENDANSEPMIALCFHFCTGPEGVTDRRSRAYAPIVSGFVSSTLEAMLGRMWMIMLKSSPRRLSGGMQLENEELAWILIQLAVPPHDDPSLEEAVGLLRRHPEVMHAAMRRCLKKIVDAA